MVTLDKAKLISALLNRVDNAHAVGVALFVVLDDDCRPTLLRHLANTRGGTYLACENYGSPRRFLLDLAGRASLETHPRMPTDELFDAVTNDLATRPRPVILDYADRLTFRVIECIFDLYRALEHEPSKSSLVLGGTRQFVERIDENDADHTIRTRCIVFEPVLTHERSLTLRHLPGS